MYEFTLYKPTKKQNGSAARFNTRANFAFLKIAPQNAPMDESKVFDWDNAINVKLNLNDIGWFKAVLSGFVDKIQQGTREGLFHQTENDSKTIRFELVSGKGFRLGVNQKPKDGDLKSLGMNLSFAEATNLFDFLRLASKEMLVSSFKKDD